MRQIKFSTFFSGLFLVAVLLTWIIFLPIQLGGATAYVIIDGNSMEPVYHKGDLVIIRRETAYNVGDIVTYFNKDLKKNVIHRIKAVQDDQFIMKGDNNTWLDEDRPFIENIIGKAWIYIPGVGTWLARSQTPLGVGLLALVIGLITISLFFSRQGGVRVRRKKTFTGSRMIPLSIEFNGGDAVMRNIGRQLETLIFVLVIILGITLFLGISSFTKPEIVDSTQTIEYIQVGKFTYQADTQAGVYDANAIQTGDPIFLKTACDVNIRFNYALMDKALRDVSGTIALRAEVHDVNGWVRSFPLTKPTVFSESNAFVQAVLHPCEIIAALKEAEAKTGLSRPFYTLMIVPEIAFTGSIGEQTVEGAFSPKLSFYFDEYQLYVTRETPEIDPYTPYLVSKVSVPSEQPNLLHLPFFSITVSLARILSLIGLLASLGLGSYVTVMVLRELKTDPSIGISLRYGTLIVDVNQISFNIRSREVTVDSFNDIVKLAERNSTAIMHLRRRDEHEFLVEGNSVVYRYRVSNRIEK